MDNTISRIVKPIRVFFLLILIITINTSCTHEDDKGLRNSQNNIDECVDAPVPGLFACLEASANP
jgi:hypothetical protein